MLDNKITVLISSNNVILKFPKCGIETSAFIGKNQNKQQKKAPAVL